MTETGSQRYHGQHFGKTWRKKYWAVGCRRCFCISSETFATSVRIGTLAPTASPASSLEDDLGLLESACLEEGAERKECLGTDISPGGSP